MSLEATNSLETQRKPRAWHLHIRRAPRTYAASPMPEGFILHGYAMRWLMPWRYSDYPSLKVGLVEVFGCRAAWGTIRDWMIGKRNMPSWAAEVLADAIETRARRGLELVAELRAYHAERVKIEAQPRGFRLIDPVTGMDGRNRAGRTRKAK